MHRAVRISDFWNWLPAFRAVAETHSLRDAAKRIHVAPSAISRTIRLLEDSLGKRLFERTGGTLVINAAGRELLEAVRAAMRVVDDAHAQSALASPCHIFCPTDVASLLLDALDSWLVAHPVATPLVHVPCAEDVFAQLLRGDLDVALTFEPATQAGVSSALLAEFSSSLYCASSDPVRERELTERDLSTLPFVDYPVGELHFLRVMRDREAQRVAYLPSMELALRMSARGKGVICVPDFVADSAGVDVARLAWSFPRASLYVSFRRPLGDAGRPAIVDHLLSHASFANLVYPPERPGKTRAPRLARPKRVR